MSDSIALAIKPIVRYPRVAQVGKTYLMTIDLEVEPGAEWNYDEEEYPVYCTVDSELFKTQIVGEPVIVLHRFGGSYGEAKFLLKSLTVTQQGTIHVKLINRYGVSIKSLKLESINILKKVEQIPSALPDIEIAELSTYRHFGNSAISENSMINSTTPAILLQENWNSNNIVHSNTNNLLESISPTNVKIGISSNPNIVTTNNIIIGGNNNIPYYFPENIGISIFIGRERELAYLHGSLQENSQEPIAIVGMSGVGKTTLARHYVMQYRSAYPGGVWWVSAAQLVLDVLGYVEQMEMRSELQEDWTEVQIVQYYFDRWDQQFGDRKLLVIDDVADYAVVKAFLPKQGSFQVLMTTKVRLGKPVKRLDLEVLEAEAALLLLRSHMGDTARLDGEIGVAQALCEWLGYLPLAIELVGRYLAETGTIGSVFGQLKAKALDARSILTVPDEMEYAYNVRAAIELSWEPLSEAERRVAMVLGVFGFGAIELKWVEACVDDADVEEILDLGLMRRSLVERKEMGYWLHSLVREFLREKLDGTEDAEKVRRSFGQLMTEKAKTIDETGRIEIRDKVRSAIPHIAEATNYVTLLEKEGDQIWSFTGLTRFYSGQSLWQEAEAWSIRCLEFTTDHCGDRHPSTASSLNNLAGLYESMGQYDRALPLFESALEIWKSELGDRHPSTATSLNNLAGLYKSMGRYDRALPLFESALEIRKSELGDRHPSTATSLNNLAGLYHSMGQYDRALPLFESALEISRSELGDRHPDTATSLNNLAALYRSMGQYDRALPLVESALEIYQSELGDRHPSTAASLNNLAELYYSTEQYDRALPLVQSALEINQSELGNQHPETATSLNNLAELYRSMGEYNRAILLLEQSLEIRKSGLGNHHPDIGSCLTTLSLVYYDINQYQKSLSYVQEALEIYFLTLGENHPKTQNLRDLLKLIQKELENE